MALQITGRKKKPRKEMVKVCSLDKERNTSQSDESNLLKAKLAALPNYELSEKDFYPPEDKRVLRSGISDIAGGDNFGDYASDYFNSFADELFDDD